MKLIILAATILSSTAFASRGKVRISCVGTTNNSLSIQYDKSQCRIESLVNGLTIDCAEPMSNTARKLSVFEGGKWVRISIYTPSGTMDQIELTNMTCSVSDVL